MNSFCVWRVFLFLQIKSCPLKRNKKKKIMSCWGIKRERKRLGNVNEKKLGNGCEIQDMGNFKNNFCFNFMFC